ncbi:methyl-CpG-binding domain protein 2 [Bombina bombina]|uniref:methyl-CpG-binding domain protein 2 n=1 Tax=Bombina bombina TaxID=8345 RepID=UPI00235B29D3|nr:methyl-CpG-binding domain protein 2 [Bombina bombina]
MEKRRMECPALPAGWKKEEVIRKSGLSAGKSDVYYYSPSGKKFRSKPQLARYLGNTVDLNSFDFRTGKMMPSKLQKNKQRIRHDHLNQNKGTSGQSRTREDLPGAERVGDEVHLTVKIIIEPYYILQNALCDPKHLVKESWQMVPKIEGAISTLVETHLEEMQDRFKALKLANSFISDAIMQVIKLGAKISGFDVLACRALWLKSWSADATFKSKLLALPYKVMEDSDAETVQNSDSSTCEECELAPLTQLFWEKRLQGLCASDITEQVIQSMELPKGLQGVGPGNKEDTLLSAIASALHTNSAPITGQLSAAVEKNPAVWLNTSQPLCKAFIVTDEDIRKQEERVQQARRKLEEAIMADLMSHADEISDFADESLHTDN